MKNYTTKTSQNKRQQGWFMPFILVLLFLGMTLPAMGQISGRTGNVPSASVDSVKTNHNVSYTADLTVPNAPGANISLEAGQGKIVLSFPGEYVVPETIANSDVTLDGESVNNVTVATVGGRTEVIVTVQKDVGSTVTETVAVRIRRAAGILNPSGTGNYTVNVFTRDWGHNQGNVTGTFSVDIIANDSQVSTPAVTPSPSVELLSAKYTISFTLGAGGRLVSDDNIYVQFPATMNMPSSSAISGVSINGTPATALSNTTKQITIASTGTFANGATLEIVIERGSGIDNPAEGSHTLTVRTDSEPSARTSTPFLISPPENLSFSAITLSDARTNAVSRYDIEFFTGDPGELRAGLDFIIITFPESTGIPGSIAGSNVTVRNEEGFELTSSSVAIDGREVKILSPVNIGDGEEVFVRIASAAGVRNPSASGNYTLLAKTERDDGVTINEETSSNAFFVSPPGSTVNNISVLPDPLTELENSIYTITFNVGDRGRLVGGFNTITIEFPAGTAYGSLTGITMNSVAVDAGTISRSGDRVTFEVPSAVSVSNLGAVTLAISHITNPGNGIYELDLRTSAEQTFVSSSTYQIGGGTINIGAVNVTPGRVNENGQYVINFTNANFPGGSRTMTLQFPSGTALPASVAGEVTVAFNNAASLTNTSVNQSNRTIRLDFDEPGGGGAPGTRAYTVNSVTFNAAAGIVNPSIPGVNYTLSGWTSVDPNPATSNTYSFTAQTASAPTLSSVTATPAVRSASNVVHIITFNTGAFGRLIGGTSAGSNTIDVRFPAGYTLPGSIAASNVSINGDAASAVSINGQVVTLTMPNGKTIGGNSEVIVQFGSAAGLTNPETEGMYAFDVRTNVETMYSGTVNLEIEEESVFTITDLSPTTMVVNAASPYTFKIIPGTNDDIQSGDAIRLIFPANTGIPSTVGTNQLTVNGMNLSAVATRENTYELVFNTPVALASDTEHTIAISSGAGILAPTLVGSYNITMRLANNEEDDSPTYTTTATSKTVSKANVSLSAPASATSADYTITFNTNTNGRLLAGTSTITARFPATTVLTGVNAGGSVVRINGTAVPGANIDVDPTARTVTAVVPAGVNIGNSGSVTYYIEDVTNPTSEGSFTLDVRTSVENTYVESNSYVISDAGPVTLNSFMLIDENGTNVAIDDATETEPRTVNRPLRYYFEITSGAALTTSDEFIIRMPEGALLDGAMTSYTDAITIIVDGGAPSNTAPSSVNINDRRVRIPVLAPIAGGVSIEISVNESGNVKNPSEPGNYSGRISTTAQPEVVLTALYELLPSITSSLTGLMVKRTTESLGVPVEWEWKFTTGANGALKPNEGKILLTFRGEASLPAEIDNATIRINGNAPNTTVVNGQTLELTIPNMTIGNSTSVTITISESANITLIDPNASIQDDSGYGIAHNRILDSHGDYSASTSAEPNDSEFSDDFDGNPQPLPIELIEFTVQKLQRLGSSVPELYWATATEKDNYGFDVYRSYSSTDDWTHIGFIEGAGTTQQMREYKFVDNSVQKAGSYFYKIVQMDYDGATEEFGPIEFLYDAPENFTLSQNYPNPFNPVTTIPFAIAEMSAVTINVYDILGRRVRTLVNEEMQPGQYNINFDASQLASGAYFVRMVTDGQVFTRKMMLIK